MFQQESTIEPTASARDRGPLFSALDLIVRLWQAKWWAAFGAVLFVALAVGATLVLKPAYEASAQVYIDPQDLQLLSNDLNPSLSPGDSGVVIIESQARIMQSASVLRDVVEQLDLVNDEEFGDGEPSVLSEILGMFKGSSAEATDPVQRAVDRLAKAVYVVRADRTYLIEVYTRARTAARSAELANAVVNSYLKLREAQRTDQASSASDSLEQRLDALLTTVKADEDALEVFKSQNDIVTANGTLLVENRLNEANLAVAATSDALSKAQVERDQLLAMADSPDLFLSSPEALASADLSRMRADLERAQGEISTLSATLGSRHPRLVAAQGQVQTIRAGISAEIQRLTTNAVLAYTRAKSQHDAALAALEPLTRDLQRTDSAAIQLRQLQRQADSSRAVYEEALTRSRQTREQAEVSTLNAQVISPATAPTQKRFPPPLSLLLPVALALGLAVGASAGLLYNAVHTTLQLPANPLKTIRRPRVPRPAPPSPQTAKAAPRRAPYSRQRLSDADAR